jgi:hypothetical protein
MEVVRLAMSRDVIALEQAIQLLPGTAKCSWLLNSDHGAEKRQPDLADCCTK